MSSLDISSRIRQCRTQKGWTQGELAEKLLGSELNGVEGEERDNMIRSVQSKVSVWERGKFEPSLSSLVELAVIFDVTLEWLGTGKEKDRNWTRGMLPLLEEIPLTFHSKYNFKEHVVTNEMLNKSLKVSVPQKLIDDGADYLVQALDNTMCRDGIYKGDYVAVRMLPLSGEEEDFIEAEPDVNTGKILHVAFWMRDAHPRWVLGRAYRSTDSRGIDIYKNDGSYNNPVTYPYDTHQFHILGEVVGWIHLEKHKKE
ncbi:MAG TPA: helix-turn-helix transcriptional regulator [bacterium]|nr:helix-turn-helix transcriptional regulator [bacterium]